MIAPSRGGDHSPRARSVRAIPGAVPIPQGSLSPPLRSVSVLRSTWGAQRSPDVPSSPEAPELPTEKAVVLQLTRGTGPTLEPFAGRVEHVASRRRFRFG